MAGGSLTTTECGHLRPQTPVKDSGSLMTTKCGHLRPQNLIFTDRANKTSTVHGVTCDHRMRSLTTTKHFHNRTTEGGGVGGGGVGGMITYLGLHTDMPKGGLVYRMITPYYKVLLESTTPVPLFTTKYNSSTTLYYSSTTPHQTLCSGCLPKFQPMLRLPTKVTLQHHQIMRLPQEVTLQHDQILRLPRKVTL